MVCSLSEKTWESALGEEGTIKRPKDYVADFILSDQIPQFPFFFTIKECPLNFITFLIFMQKLFGELTNYEMARTILIKVLTDKVSLSRNTC